MEFCLAAEVNVHPPERVGRGGWCGGAADDARAGPGAVVAAAAGGDPGSRQPLGQVAGRRDEPAARAEEGGAPHGGRPAPAPGRSRNSTGDVGGVAARQVGTVQLDPQQPRVVVPGAAGPAERGSEEGAAHHPAVGRAECSCAPLPNRGGRGGPDQGLLGPEGQHTRRGGG